MAPPWVIYILSFYSKLYKKITRWYFSIRLWRQNRSFGDFESWTNLGSKFGVCSILETLMLSQTVPEGVKFYKIYRKPPVLESLFNIVIGLRPLWIFLRTAFYIEQLLWLLLNDWEMINRIFYVNKDFFAIVSFFVIFYLSLFRF